MTLKAPFGYLLLGGVFLFLDRFLKWQAEGAWSMPVPIDDYLGWEPYLNRGIAFGIEVPTFLILIFSMIIITIVGYFFYRHFGLQDRMTRLTQGVALVLVLSGAISNLIDRLLYQYTIDYIRIFTGVINLADCLIVAGFVLYFWTLRGVK